MSRWTLSPKPVVALIECVLGNIKRHLALLLFRHFQSVQDFPLVECELLCRLRPLLKDRVRYSPAITNAGLVRIDEVYLGVAKNQNFSFCAEMRAKQGASAPAAQSDDGLRALYRFELDATWQIAHVRELQVEIDGMPLDPIVFVEDVRLLTHQGEVVAFANGNGAWPLLGTLREDKLVLRNLKAAFARPQKNWMPFGFDGQLLLEYSIQPHVILQADSQDGTFVEVYRTELPSPGLPAVLHGGAPALRLDSACFLGVGNSQHAYWFQARYYAAVFYIFEAAPPFRILRTTRPLRLGSRSERIQYVCGMSFGQSRNSVVLSMGICDCDNYIVQIPLDSLMAQMH